MSAIRKAIEAIRLAKAGFSLKEIVRGMLRDA
jgi:hypothetical protein